MPLVRLDPAREGSMFSESKSSSSNIETWKVRLAGGFVDEIHLALIDTASISVTAKTFISFRSVRSRWHAYRAQARGKFVTRTILTVLRVD